MDKKIEELYSEKRVSAEDAILLDQALRATSAGAEDLALRDRRVRRGLVRNCILGLIAVLVVACSALFFKWSAIYYNELVQLNEEATGRLAQVETVLQRRLDVIPPLVETLKGYAAHEKETLASVIEARTKLIGSLSSASKSADKVKQLDVADAAVQMSLGRILALAESYPDLKASTNFLALQGQLEGSENRISIERMRYNEAARNFNGKLQSFPYNLVAKFNEISPQEYFKAKPAASDPVKVDF